MVGAEGFEPPTLCSQSRCATRLRYAPTSRLSHERGPKSGNPNLLPPNALLRTLPEADPLRLGPAPDDEDHADENDRHEHAHRLLIREDLAQRGLEVRD